MSNYPPTPSYGGSGSFNYNGQFAPPPQPNHHHMMHHPIYSQPGDSMYGHQAPAIPQPPPIPIPHSLPYNNAYNFNLNSQIPTPNLHGAYPPQHSPFAGFGQYQNGALPPPPFPPVPIPNYSAMPQRLTAPISQVPSPSTLQPHMSLPAKPPQNFGQTVSLDQESSHPGTIVSADREDGELSDSELRREARTTNSSISSSVNRKRDTKGQSDSTTNAVLGQVSKSREGRTPTSELRHNNFEHGHPVSKLKENLPPNRNDSAGWSKSDRPLEDITSNSVLREDGMADTYPPDNAKVSTQEPASLNPPPRNQYLANDLSMGKPTMTESPSWRPGLSPVANKQKHITHPEDQKLRDRVKEALRDLYNNEVDFEKLRAEGIDASILRKLYLEMGITIPFQPSLEEPNPVVDITNTVPTQEQLAVETAHEQNHSQNDASTKIPTSSTPQPNVRVSMPADSAQPTSSSQSIPEDKNPEKLILSNGRQDIVKENDNPAPLLASKASTPIIPKKASSGDKALERKDYIAKMLAAKSGKSLGAAKASKSSETPPVSTEAKVTEAVSVTNASMPASISVSTPISGPSDKEIDVENKRRAQTELARRKMEALKSHSSARRVEQPVRTEAPTPLPSQSVSVSESPPMYPVLNESQSSPSRPSPPPLQLQPSQQTNLKSSPPPPYIPSSSFFSSLGRRPLSGIPGLFTSTLSFPPTAPSSLSTQHDPPVSSAIDTTKPAISEVPTISPVSLTAETVQPPVPVVVSSNEPVIINPPRASSIQLDTTMNSKPFVLSTVEQSRKRPKAADFIDSPSARTKRNLGSSQHPDVFIELSEDEDDTENDRMDVDNMPETEVLQNVSLSTIQGAKAKAIRDLPSLSDFPPRMKPQMTSSINTPPMVQTPGKVKEQATLKLKEEQIHVLQRKIAEMEMRRKAKQITSRMQSPGTSGLAQTEITVDPSPQSSSSPNGFQGNLDKKESVKAREKQLQEQQNALILTEGDTLEALKAEGYKNVADISITDAVQLAISELSSENSTKVDASSQQPRMLEDQPVFSTSETSYTVNGLENGKFPQALSLVEMQHKQERKTYLEMALLEVDVQTEKKSSKLKDLKEEVQELEAEIQQGIESRQSFLEELNIFRTAKGQTTTNGQKDSSPIAQPMEVDGPTSSIIVDRGSVTDDTQPKQNGLHRLSITRSTTSSPIHRNDQALATRQLSTQQSDNVEEVMDISSSSSDEGEITDSSGRLSVDRQILAEFGGSLEDYEPQLEDEVTLTQKPDARSSVHSEDDQIVDSFAASPAKPVPSISDDIDHKPQDSQEYHQISHNIPQGHNEAEKIIVPDVGNESDDYEPPEPASPVDNQAVSMPSDGRSPKAPTPPNGSISYEQSLSLSSPPAAKALSHSSEQNGYDSNTERGQSIVDKNQTKAHDPKRSHFTRYESPLSIFTSYRYHPKYASEVSNGFRSLTYSHKINPNEPVCRWELAGGICNDDSCDSQHFRSMVMSDDMILVQMSSAQEGSTQEEKDAYVAGLRKIIHDMRIKKVKDFDTVASEIAAYRARFRGDSSRILPL